MSPIFGSVIADVLYRERRAAYLVAVNESGAIAAVQGRAGYFLPGGGSLPGETDEQTILREVVEELGCGVTLTGRIGTARQYFYALSDDCHYKMSAVFWSGELVGEPVAGEYELLWLPPGTEERLFFHECHEWAIQIALDRRAGDVVIPQP